MHGDVIRNEFLQDLVLGQPLEQPRGDDDVHQAVALAELERGCERVEDPRGLN